MCDTLHDLACNFTKSNTPWWVFFTFLKWCKWYQILQSVLCISRTFFPCVRKSELWFLWSWSYNSFRERLVAEIFLPVRPLSVVTKIFQKLINGRFDFVKTIRLWTFAFSSYWFVVLGGNSHLNIFSVLELLKLQ